MQPLIDALTMPYKANATYPGYPDIKCMIVDIGEGCKVIRLGKKVKLGKGTTVFTMTATGAIYPVQTVPGYSY